MASLAFEASPLAGILVAVVGACACVALGAVSVGPRRVVWWSASVAALLFATHAAAPVPLMPAQLAAFDAPRAALAHAVLALVPSPDGALLVGIVLGDRSGVPPSLAAAFAATGTTHLLAISGFNMTLVATGVSLALQGRVGPVARAVSAIAAVAMYSLLVGLAPSVLRAALMAAVATCGTVTGRRAASANALCAAVTAMLVADPSAIADLGLQLSALATAGLVVGQARIAERIAPVPALLREGLSTTLAATLPTMPVVAGAFGRVSLVALPANLICVPLFPALMLSGAATAIAGAISPDLARPASVIAWASTAAVRHAIEAFAALPFASLTVPASPLTGALMAVAEAMVLWRVRNVRLRSLPRLGHRVTIRLPPLPKAMPVRARGGALALSLALVPAGVVLAWPAAVTARVVALDVGQGDAYLVEVGSATMLIDGGPDPARVVDELAATLGPWRHRIDVVALTHAHTDHGAGLLAVLERYEVGLAIEPVGLNASPLTDLWHGAAAKAGVARRAVRAGTQLVLGDATVTVLAPDDMPVDVPSLVLRVERGSFSALFTGDAVDDALSRLLARPEALHARVYVPPHHGAETPYAVALRAAVHPDAALISVGAGNRYGHPTPSTLAALAGVPTYRTDQDGTVEIAADGADLVVHTHANALPPPRRGSLPYLPSR